MKRTLASLVGAILLLSGSRAEARPPYAPLLVEFYPANAALKAAAGGAMKCNLCHIGMGKKMRNEFGTALSKTMTKDEFFKVMANKEALVESLKEALSKTETEKNARGETFGDLLKAGVLPGGELK